MRKFQANSVVRHLLNLITIVVNSSKTVFREVEKSFLLEEQWTTRILAAGIDYVLLMLLTGTMKDMLFADWNFSLTSYFLMLGLTSFLYFVAAETLLGYTLGKRVFGIKVVTDGGGKPSLKNAVIRNVSKTFIVLLLMDSVVTRFVAAASLNQRYTDKIAHTIVKRM